VASEVRWFAEQGVQNATLKLTPEHLGPVEVHLALSDGQVNVNFSASHSDTRQALEQSLPQLRDMLAGAGLSLGQAHVQQQMRQGSQNSFSPGGASADNGLHEPSATIPMRLGLVDEYA
jgi:flagellar hook-length control protein FliK